MCFLKYSVSWVVAVPDVQTEAALCKQRVNNSSMMSKTYKKWASIFTFGPKLKIYPNSPLSEQDLS